jgi:ribosome-binding protein aMBF1 (putative translation factor)
VVIRDHHGGFRAGAGHFFPHLVDAEGAELQACRSAVMLAKEIQVQKLVLETDSAGSRKKAVGRKNGSIGARTHRGGDQIHTQEFRRLRDSYGEALCE